MVKKNEGVGHKELVDGSETILHGHAGGKLSVFTSKPMPSAEYLGRRIIVRPGAGTDSKIYVCTINDLDEYEWFQLTNTQHVFSGGCGNIYLDTGYASIQGQQTIQDNPDKCYIPIIRAGTLKELFCRITSFPGAGNSWAFTIWKAWEDTALACILGAAEASGEDMTNKVDLVKGDRICMRIIKTGNPNPTFASWGIGFEET